MRIGAKFTTLLTASALTALSCGLVAAAATSASAAPGVPSAPQHVVVTHQAKKSVVHSDVASDSDSSLSALAVTGDALTALAPAFDPGTHVYEAFSADDSDATVTPTTNADDATADVTSANTTDPLVSGTATVPLVRGRNDITITVTSADTTSTSIYTVTVWRHVAPSVQIVSTAGATSTVYGGARMTVTLSDGALPPDCYRYYLTVATTPTPSQARLARPPG
jgi:cadherin-like protein